jgi:hypothetical protein
MIPLKPGNTQAQPERARKGSTRDPQRKIPFASTVKGVWHSTPPLRRDSGSASISAITRMMEQGMASSLTGGFVAIPKREGATRKTHCRRGHEMTPENTYTRPSDGYTECVTCQKASRLARRETERAVGIKFSSVRASGKWVGGVQNYNFPKIKFCSEGHAIIGDNIAISGRSIRCRTCALANHRSQRKNGRLAEGVIRKVLLGLEDGMTFNNLAGRKGDKYIGGAIVNLGRLNRFCDESPKLGKRIRTLAEKNKIRAISQPRPVTAIKLSIVRASNDIMGIISAAVPRHLPKDLRDDAIQNIWMAVLEGRLKCSEIASRAHEFVRAEYKSNHNAWSPRSLDVPLWIDSNTTLLDTLASGSSGLWD